MRDFERSRRRTIAATLLAVCVLVVGPCVADAVTVQAPETPQRSQRALLIGSVAFVKHPEPALTVGGFYQVSVFPSRVSFGPDCGGLGCVSAPHLYAHVQASVGGSTHERTYAALGNIGFMYKLDRTPLSASTIISAVGVIAVGAMPESAIGPAVRLEIFHNLAVQAGWVYLESSDRGGVFASVDFYWRLFDDLFLGNRVRPSDEEGGGHDR